MTDPITLLAGWMKDVIHALISMFQALVRDPLQALFWLIFTSAWIAAVWGVGR